MGDVFDGVNLEDIANSESPILDSTGMEEPVKEEPKAETEAQATGNEEEIITDGIDISTLEGLEAVSDSNENKKEVIDEEKGDGDNKNTSQTPASNSEGSSPSSQNKFTSFATTLSEAGVFSSLEEDELKDIKDVDTLVSAIAKQIKTNEHIGLNEDQKEYLKALEAGIPTEDYAKSKSTAEQYKSISDDQIQENQNLQYELIRRGFKLKGHSDKDSDKYAKLAVTTGDGLEDALQAKQALVAHEEGKIQSQIEAANAAKLQEAEAEKEALATLKSKLNEASDVLPGIKVTTPTKDKIYASMVTPTKVEDGEALNEVMDSYKNSQDYKLKLHAMHVITKGFTDFSKFSNIKASKAASDFSEILASSGDDMTKGAGNSSFAGGKTTSDIADSLKNVDFSKFL